MTTTPNFRALCGDMLFAVQLYTGQNPAASEMSSVELTEKLMDAMAATAAALATPPPEPPTDEELRKMFDENDWNYMSPETFKDIARTVLQEWGK
jgi:hypothetical protein